MTEIITTNRCTNLAISTLKCQVQIIASCSPHLFTKCAEQSLFIRALMISDGMSILWITLNLSNLQSFLVLIFADVRFENNRPTNSTEEFRQAKSIMNPIAVVQFFKAIYTGIFKCFLATRSIERGLLGTVSIYFGMLETNGQGMLYLHCLV